MKIYFILIVLIISSCSENKISVEEFKNDSLQNFLATASDRKSNYENRKYFNSKAEKLLLRQPTNLEHRKSYYKIALNFHDIYDFKRLKQSSSNLLKQSLNVNDSLHIARAYMLYYIYYNDTNQMDSAFFYVTKAEKILKSFVSNEDLCKVYYGIGLTRLEIHDFLGSEVFLIKALKISKKEGFFNEKYKCYVSLGINSFMQQEYEKAIQYYKLALKVSDEHILEINSAYKAQIYCNIGSVFSARGDDKMAISFYEMALKENSILIEDPETYTNLIDNLGISMLQLRNFSKIPQLYFKAEKIRDSLNIYQGRNYNKLYLSEYFGVVKDTIKAVFYAKEAFKISKELSAPNDMLLSLKQLSKVEPANELKYAKQYIRISDSMQQLERQTRNKFAKIAYETEEITEEKNTAVLHKWILFSVAVAISIFAFLLLVIRSQKSKQRKLEFLQVQQKSNEEIYHLIQTQQRKIDEGRQIEKRRIAQDLHDGVMNKLASTRFNLHVITKTDQSGIFEKCQPFINGIQDVEKEIRNIAHDLNNDVFAENYSFINALNLLFEDFQIITAANWHIEIDNNINWEIIKSADKIHIYRIFQEALQNIVKHANANNIIIKIALQDEHLIIEIYDDGDGFSSNAKKKGIGLQNITSRANQCGGSVDIKSNGGTFIRITMPRPTQTNINNDKH